MTTKYTKEQIAEIERLTGKKVSFDINGNLINTANGTTLSMDDIISSLGSRNEKQQLDYNKAENELAKKSAGGSMANTAVQGALGLGQTIGGAKILSKLKAPKYPYELLPNKQLSSRLAEVQKLSQMGDPIIREKMLQDYVNQKNQLDQVARVTSGGDVSSFGAQSQANANRLNDNIRDISLSELDFKTRQGGILDGLIARKMQEDANVQAGRVAKFNDVDYPEFKARRSYGENLVNKGLSNTIKSIQGATENKSILDRTKMNDGLFAKQEKVSDRANKNTPLVPIKSNLLPVEQPITTLGNIQPIQVSPLNNANTSNVSSMIKTPIVRDNAYKTGDMAYMTTPDGYKEYISKVNKLTPEQILYQYQNQTNPKTKKLYNINDVPDIIKGMTDYDIGAKHRMAQTLINQYGL